MPPKMQMPAAPTVQGHHFTSALYEIFLYIALSAAVFTRRRFGHQAVFPLKLLFVAALFWGYHDFIFPLLAQSFEPSLRASPTAEIFCGGMVALSLFHWIAAKIAYGKGGGPHTHYIGEPWLLALAGLAGRSPKGEAWYWLSVALDILLIAVAGYYLAYLDAATGLWLIVAAASLAGITLRSLKQLRRDVRDMRNAGVQAELVSERTPTRSARATAAAAPRHDAEEVSTGATRRR